MDRERMYVVVGMAAMWSVAFTVISCLMMAGVPWFRPSFYYGSQVFTNGTTTLTTTQLFVINSAVVISTVKLVGALIILAEMHGFVQRRLFKYRPQGPGLHRGMARFDIVTSFLPFFANLLVFVITWFFKPHDPWWLWLQGLYGLIILAATRGDVLPTIRYWYVNRAHM